MINKYKEVKRAGRCYIIRAYSPVDETSEYIMDISTGRIGNDIKKAIGFETAEQAETALKILNGIRIARRKNRKKDVEKKYSLYISKAFYTSVRNYGDRICIIPAKLTKPDRYDFINGI